MEAQRAYRLISATMPEEKRGEDIDEAFRVIGNAVGADGTWTVLGFWYNDDPVAVADAAGGTWPQRAMNAFLEMALDDDARGAWVVSVTAKYPEEAEERAILEIHAGAPEEDTDEGGTA